MGLNTAYVIFEATFGFLTGSLALLAEAAHNLIDVSRTADRLGGCGAGQARGQLKLHLRLWPCDYPRRHVERGCDPDRRRRGGLGSRAQVPDGGPGAGADDPAGRAGGDRPTLLFIKSQKDDLNAKGANLQMAADAAVSVAVVIAAAGIMLTGSHWLDPAVAISVSLLIAWTARGLLRNSP